MLLWGAGPVRPDGEEARRWAEQELSDPAYAPPAPSPIDLIARSIRVWFESLFGGGGEGALGVLAAVALALVVVGVVVAALVVGRRARQRARAGKAPRLLFGDPEARAAAVLRAEAERQAHVGDWSAAVVLRMRAAAAGVVERGLLDVPPGTTVHGFARATATLSAEAAGSVEAAADAFDDVRYLQRRGTPESYAAVVAADDALAAVRPTSAVPAR